MLSTFPAMMTPDGLFGNPFPAFEGGFTTLDSPEPPFVFPHYDEPVFSPIENQEPVISNSGSDNLNPMTTNSNTVSDESNRKSKNSGSGSDDTSQPFEAVPATDERKRRRMISNRESARRSRMRKQQHLDNLRNQSNRLRATNRELMNRLRLAMHHCQLIRSDNDRIRSESILLQQRLWDIRQVLLVQQLQQQFSAAAWPCYNFGVCINDETIPQPLIT